MYYLNPLAHIELDMVNVRHWMLIFYLNPLAHIELDLADITDLENDEYI